MVLYTIRRKKTILFENHWKISQAPCILEKIPYHDGVSTFDSRKCDHHFSPSPHFNTMKKFFALCTMIVALGFVAGCPGKAKDEKAPENKTPAVEKATGSETPPADAGADKPAA